MRLPIVVGFVALTACGFATSANAAVATVQAERGNISIDRGTGFQKLTAASPAEAGYRVMAAPGSSAKIIYADGCTVKVQPGSVVSVGTKSPCTAPHLAGLEPVDPRGTYVDPGVTGTGWGVVPLVIGVTAAAVAYCISGPCSDDDEFRGRASP